MIVVFIFVICMFDSCCMMFFGNLDWKEFFVLLLGLLLDCYFGK